MSKKRTTKPKQVNGAKVTPVKGEPASQRVCAPECQCCHNERTYIYATRGRLRYCKCRRCGWTWSISGDLAASVDNIQTR